MTPRQRSRSDERRDWKLVVVALVCLTAIAAIMPIGAYGQYSVCDATVAHLVDRRNQELAAISKQRDEQKTAVNQKFSSGLQEALAATHRQHLAKMEEVAAEQAALEGNHFEKFFSMIPIWAKRAKIQQDTRKANGEAQSYWRSWRFDELAGIDTRLNFETEAVQEAFAGAIARRRAAECP
jgi:hypothetical protein